MSESPCNSPFSRQSKPRFTEYSAAKSPWTTRRCNHLLRSLSSRLADLRKLEKEPIQVTGEARIRLNPRHSITSDAIISPSQDWASSPIATVRIRRTYSTRESGNGLQRRALRSEKEPSLRISRSGSGTYHQSLLGEFLPKLDLDSGPSVKNSPISKTIATIEASRRGFCSNKKAPTEDLLPQGIKASDPKRWKLIGGILMALVALLNATSNHKIVNPIGSRSLFSTCLRKTWDYITAEELRSKEEDPENTIDMSTTVYNDLEAIGSSTTGGWNPLREVVRAHGVAMLGTAVKDGLLDTVVARSLAGACLRHGAFDEGQHIMECMISTLKPVEKPASIRSSLLGRSIVGMLDHFACSSRRYDFQYRELAKLFREGILPIEWMTTNDMIPCWNRLMLSLTQGKENTRDAEVLLRTVLSMSFRVPYKSLPCRMHNIRLRANNFPCTSSGQPSFSTNTCKALQPPKQKQLQDEDEVEDMDHALRTTSLHLLAILSAINFLRSSASSVDSGYVNLPVLQDIILEVHQAFDVWQHDYSSGGTSSFVPDTDLICLPLLAAGFVSARISKDRVDVNRMIYQNSDILKRWNPSPAFADTAATFLCLVINNCGQASSINAFEYLQEFVQCLTQSNLFTDNVPEMKGLFRTIASTAAIKWSKGTNIPKHLTWALDLESSTNRMTLGANIQTPSRSSVVKQFLTKTRCGFRWEDGICEWVARTPVIPTPKSVANVQQDESVILGQTKSDFKRDEDISKSAAGTPAVPLIKSDMHMQQKKTNTIWYETKSLPKRDKGIFNRVEEIPANSMAKPVACGEQDKLVTSSNDVCERGSRLSLVSKTKFNVHKQQDNIDRVLNSEMIVAPDPSAKFEPCLVEVSSNSLKSNGVAKIAEAPFLPFKKSACAIFSRVEIYQSQRNNSGKVRERAQERSKTNETGEAKVDPRRSSKVDTIVLSKETSGGHAQTLDTQPSHIEARTTRNSHRLEPCKRKASPLSTPQQPESARTKRQKQLAEQADSEDELSFS